MKQALTVAATLVVVIAAAVLLSGCEDPSIAEQRRYETCLAAGGTYDARSAGHGYSCTLPSERIVEVPRA